MNSKTTAEIKKEIEDLKTALKRNIDEFLKSNPGLDLNIELEKEVFGFRDGNAVSTYNPKIEVILK
ncbi:hypothetical protein [Chryseobacterium sp. 2VB]|uniref:hypothetical protein n=1 Tax=Chryseobacterium sp. 2VB TaxID=2502204 RepID=UPI0010F9A168|nr:hypothetical protein [Chryseobacterium sp. 2VB]